MCERRTLAMSQCVLRSSFVCESLREEEWLHPNRLCLTWDLTNKQSNHAMVFILKKRQEKKHVCNFKIHYNKFKCNVFKCIIWEYFLTK